FANPSDGGFGEPSSLLGFFARLELPAWCSRLLPGRSPRKSAKHQAAIPRPKRQSHFLPSPRDKDGVPAYNWKVAGPTVRGRRLSEVIPVSIVRVGLAETKKFAEGYEAIFGKVKAERPQSKPRSRKATSAKKKKTKKK